jgi:hypothetical protein
MRAGLTRVWFRTGAEAKRAATARYEEVTSSSAFREWFGRSKVVDPKGRPLVVYHGAGSGDRDNDDLPFTVFEPDHGPSRGGLLAFFSTSTRFADNYAGHAPAGPSRVCPVFLKIEYPYDYRIDPQRAIDFYEGTGGVQDSHEARRILMGLGVDIEDIMDRRWSAEDLTAKRFARAVRRGSWDAIENDEFVEYLRRAWGHDGIITRECRATNFGVFKPWQIKSATGNLGAFDKSEPDIRHNPWQGRSSDRVRSPRNSR